MPGNEISKPALFERLAEGHAAGITVVTPNRRLAQVLRAEFDAFQSARKRPVWEDVDILPYDAFVQRVYEDSIYADGAGDLPQLLTPAQERRLWETVLEGAELLSVADTAADCADAWRIAHAWRIEGAAFSEPAKFPGNEDTQVFAGWAREYRKRCASQGFTDAARLPDLKLAAARPKQLVAFGFDILPPQSRDFLGPAILECGPERKTSNNKRVSFPSARHELAAAANWARARLEEGRKRIGVVVPDLKQRRREVVRVFARTMNPGPALPAAARPFNVSLGEPLIGYPLVAAALGILEFAFGEKAFEEASSLVRSPFLGGAEQEMLARAQLDAQLREELGERVSLGKVLALAGPCPQLRSLLEALFAKAQRKEAQLPHDWAQHFTGLLQAAGFPGERTLDSEEFQARASFEEQLGEFARLGALPGKMSAREALRQLRRICTDALFQPELPGSSGVPVQVVGVLESAGMEFDCLWVGGLSEENWPLKAHPHPFLPVALQKKAGVTQAAAETSLAFDRRITQGWLAAADEVVLSWPEKDGDRDLLPSPLIADIPLGSVEVVEVSSYQDVLFQARNTESFTDDKAPPLREQQIRGGTRVLADQAACPFRAFAHHRLRAEELAAPSAGPDAMDRGTLLHTLMALIWKEVKTSAGLERDLSDVIARSARESVRQLGLEGRFAELEQRRLEKLAREWLDIERGRPAFEVVAIEEKRGLDIGGLAFSGRIDRMDRLAGGGHALIDYKTGAHLTPRMWMDPRPDEPQLPLYAATAGEKVTAVAFARLKTGAMRYMGYAAEKDALPGLTHYPTWQELLQGWKAELEALAAGFAQGSAQVDPKRGLSTCRYCDLKPLCRVHERLSALAEEGEERE